MNKTIWVLVLMELLATSMAQAAVFWDKDNVKEISNVTEMGTIAKNWYLSFDYEHTMPSFIRTGTRDHTLTECQLKKLYNKYDDIEGFLTGYSFPRCHSNKPKAPKCLEYTVPEATPKACKDLMKMLSCSYNSKEGDKAYNDKTDFNDDGKVNLQDLAIFSTHINHACWCKRHLRTYSFG